MRSVRSCPRIEPCRGWLCGGASLGWCWWHVEPLIGKIRYYKHVPGQQTIALIPIAGSELPVNGRSQLLVFRPGAMLDRMIVSATGQTGDQEAIGLVRNKSRHLQYIRRNSKPMAGREEWLILRFPLSCLSPIQAVDIISHLSRASHSETPPAGVSHAAALIFLVYYN